MRIKHDGWSSWKIVIDTTDSAFVLSDTAGKGPFKIRLDSNEKRWEIDLPVLYKKRRNGTFDELRIYLVNDEVATDSCRMSIVSIISNPKTKERVYKTPVAGLKSKPYGAYLLERVESKWNKKKLRDGWSLSMEAPTLQEPLLLHQWEDYGPALLEKEGALLLSPKLNGVRATYRAVDETLYSRKRNPFILPTLLQQLNTVAMSCDGEIWHPTMSFEEITGIIKAKSDARKKELQFWVFDSFQGGSFVSRMQSLVKHISRYAHVSPNIVCVPQVLVKSLDEIHAWEDRISREAGTDGIVLRSLTYKYQFDIRSKLVLKKKRIVHEEYKCIGVDYDNDAQHGRLIVFLFQHRDGTGFFKYVPNWTKKERSTAYHSGINFVGKIYTLAFREYTNTGLPKHIMSLTERNYE